MLCDICEKYTRGPLSASIAQFIIEHEGKCECNVPDIQLFQTLSTQSVKENYQRDITYLQQQIDECLLAIEHLIKEIEKLKKE
ncbi:MAG: hypothetical protein ACXAC2_17460 [Candidatus Kariarchaeaceae archaeon]|jgi:hypothetical protein